MKNSILSLSLILCGLVAFANEPGENVKMSNAASISVELGEEAMVNVQVLDDSRGKARITILKNSGTKLFTETINYSKSFRKGYDLSDQKPGAYTFVVHRDGKDYTHQVFIPTTSREDVFATVTRLENNAVNVKILHEDVPVEIKIVNSEGRKVFSKTYTRDSNFQQKFDLSAYKGKQLTMYISGEKSFIRKNI
ncbi:MAG: hypothetical protein JXQ90_23615 [Cyclobacteriaceae bacterium]